MKKYFISCFYILFLSLISVDVLICSEDKKAPDTTTGIAYQVLFEQRLPLLDKAVDPNNIAETIATILMLNRFEKNVLRNETALLKEAFGKSTSIEKQLESTKKTALKKIKEEIYRIIDEDIIKVIDKQSKLFESHGKKGFIGKTIDNARGWFAKKLSKDKKALKDYNDFEFRHVSPAYTDAAPGLLKNNVEFLYEEICNIILASRKVGDLFALYVFFNNEKQDILTAKIKHMQTSAEKLQSTLQTYTEELEKQRFDTTNDLLFFAKQYDSNSASILKTISTYLHQIAKNALAKAPKDKNSIVSTENIENFLTFVILPSSFLDTDVVTFTNRISTNINALEKEKNQSKQDLTTATKEKIAAQQKNKILTEQNEELTKQNKELQAEIKKLKEEIDSLKKESSSLKGRTVPVETKTSLPPETIETKRPPIHIPYTGPKTSEASTNLLAIQNQLVNVKNITELENVKKQVSLLTKPSDDNKTDLELYNSINKSIEEKITEYVTKNLQNLNKTEETINNAKALDVLTELENKINDLKLSTDPNSQDVKKKAEIIKQLATKKLELQPKK